jgi:hypothetical protein
MGRLYQCWKGVVVSVTHDMASTYAEGGYNTTREWLLGGRGQGLLQQVLLISPGAAWGCGHL